MITDVNYNQTGTIKNINFSPSIQNLYTVVLILISYAKRIWIQSTSWFVCLLNLLYNKTKQQEYEKQTFSRRN